MNVFITFENVLKRFHTFCRQRFTSIRCRHSADVRPSHDQRQPLEHHQRWRRPPRSRQRRRRTRDRAGPGGSADGRRRGRGPTVHGGRRSSHSRVVHWQRRGRATRVYRDVVSTRHKPSINSVPPPPACCKPTINRNNNVRGPMTMTNYSANSSVKL